jgi:hypothetical protein
MSPEFSQVIILTLNPILFEELGINHGDWIRNVVAKYQKETEQAFGHLRFENGTVTNSVGAINTVKMVSSRSQCLCGSYPRGISKGFVSTFQGHLSHCRGFFKN